MGQTNPRIIQTYTKCETLGENRETAYALYSVMETEEVAFISIGSVNFLECENSITHFLLANTNIHT